MVKNTFKNLQSLETTRNAVKAELGQQYEEKLMPFVKLIQIVMKSNNTDHFTAMLMIKDTLDLYKQENAPFMFSAAVMELVENKHFGNLVDLEV